MKYLFGARVVIDNPGLAKATFKGREGLLTGELPATQLEPTSYLVAFDGDMKIQRFFTREFRITAYPRFSLEERVRHAQAQAGK